MEQKYPDLSLVAGANLRRLIKESKYGTQEEFAYAFGTEDRNVRRWISKGINKLSTITEIARFFDIDVKEVLSL